MRPFFYKDLICDVKKWVGVIAAGCSQNMRQKLTAKISAARQCGAVSGCSQVPCFHPLQGYKSRTWNPETGKRSVVFNAREGYVDLPISIPCGRCIGCRLERSRQWAMRCVHEAQLHPENSFLTLTYDDEHLPYGGTLIKKHFQDFMKRLRRWRERKLGRKLRQGELMYFHCGEYGDKSRRPHYHVVLFGFDFSDKLRHKITPRGDSVFTSEALCKLWGMGFCTIGAVTFESAAYTARYVLKKVGGAEKARGHYTVVMADGDIVELEPEYVTMSLKPTVGKNWYREFNQDVYPDDFVVVRGKRMKPPKYYDRMHELEDP